jgi:two-component sensor histidine kinase
MKTLRLKLKSWVFLAVPLFLFGGWLLQEGPAALASLVLASGMSGFLIAQYLIRPSQVPIVQEALGLGLEDIVRERTRSLEAALRAKDILLREIHHRVKNNLQIISSLLSLQSGHVKDPHVAGVLTESRNRVKSMALVHERLYAGDDLQRVGFGGYLRDLAALLVRSSEGNGRSVNLRFDLVEIQVNLTQAIPCGLAVHELVSNAMKHGFPDGQSSAGGLPEVKVRCRPLPLGGFELEVEDNGVGLPVGFNPRKCRSLGLQLVFTLVKQVRGVLEMDRGAGTRVRIAIPVSEEKENVHAV